MIGRTLSHYKILSKLGEGAMGQVYLAEDTHLGRKVALKIPPAEFAADPKRLQRYEREARVVAALNHPNIVTLHSIEEADGVRFLTMELVEGKNLAQLLPDDGFPVERLFELAIPITDALSAAHDAGIIHRDLKPENIMLNDKGQVKILDFGLAKLHFEGDDDQAGEPLTQTLTQEGMVVGTVPYMSPEQVQGKPVDRRSDIFSLGVILFEMTTGRRPFKGETSAHIISSIMRDTPVAVGELKADLPHHLGRMIKHCLEKDPERRFQTAKDVRNELDELKKEMGSGEVRSSGATPTAPASKRLAWHYALPIAAVLLIALLAVFSRSGERSTGGPAESAEGRRDGAAAATQAAAEQGVSVAVLPFANLSTDEENEVFCDGLTEELIHALVKVEGLNVPARTSVYALKGKEFDVQEAGQKLGVENVLEGSVRRAGDRLRISAQLVKVADGFHIWSESYDRQLEDVFAIQDEIARSIVDALQLTLSPGQAQALQTVRSANAEAYEYYLRGQGYARRQRRAESLRSRDMFLKAIEIDPAYAPAYAGLSVHYTSYYRTYESMEEVLEQANWASSRAIELAPDLAEARAARGYALGANQQFEEAEREFELALRLNPRLSETYDRYAIISTTQGKLEKAARLYEKAVEMEPDDYRSISILPQLYRSLGREEQERDAHRRALAATERRLSFDPDNLNALLFSGISMVALGDREQGLKRAERVMAAAGEGEALLLYNAACVFSLAGEIERGIEALEKSFDAGLGDPAWMKHDSDLDPLRDHPRFLALLERIDASSAG